MHEVLRGGRGAGGAGRRDRQRWEMGLKVQDFSVGEW